MISLKGKNVFITGVTSGIGKACAYAFAEAGAGLIISARRQNLVEEITKDIISKFGVKVFGFKMDVRSRSEVKDAVSALPDEWKKIDILINNAGLAKGFTKFYLDDPDAWDEMIDTNVKGLLYVTREILPGMVERNSGHIINIGSTAGHEAYPNGSVYCATKFAVDALTKAIRMDTVDKNIRVSTVDPGAVETNFSNIRFYGDTERAKKVYAGLTPLVAEDIADSILFIATRKPHVNIAEMIMMPISQASSLVFHREEK